MDFHEEFTVPGFLHPLAYEVARHSRALNHLDGINGVRVTPNVLGGFDIDADPGTAGASVPDYPGLWYPRLQTDVLSDIQDPEIIQIGYGYFVDSMRSWKLDGTLVKVTGGTLESPTFAYLEYTHDGIPVIADQTISAFPVPTSTVYRRALVETALVQGVPVIVNRLCRDIIEISGLMGRL